MLQLMLFNCYFKLLLSLQAMPSLQYNASMFADGFLSKYCIFQNGVDDMYRKVFDSVRTELLRVHNYITTHVISCDHVCFTCGMC